MQITAVVATRPQIIGLSYTIAKLSQYCDQALVHTGQNYDYEEALRTQ